MATAADKARRKKCGQDWSTSGSFINKPAKGWLHPDEQLKPDAGICYGVRYVGCMEVKQSMKSLDFETRTAVAKESISRVCESAGLKSSPKKVKKSKVSKLLGETPNMIFAGANVNLTITTECIAIMIMESGEIIASHQMPGISFASGGDPDTMDFVAYVAKDEMFGRSCHVLECGGGLAQDVITTIGQAFEIRFKQFLAKRPNAVNIPNRQETGPANADAWGNEPDERDYYNDRPGAQPPDAPPPAYTATPSNIPVAGNGSRDLYNSVRDSRVELEDNALYDNGEGDGGAVYDNNEDQQPTVVYDNSQSENTSEGVEYDNKVDSPSSSEHLNGDLPQPHLATYHNNTDDASASHSAASQLPTPLESQDSIVSQMSEASVSEAPAAQNGKPDNFDMDAQPPTLDDLSSSSPHGQPWFHGKITRQQVEELLAQDGDFLVRESTHSLGQFVLSGRHQGRIKHLLLIDPEGIVRTKDRTFDSIAHLIKYHMSEKLPITSSDSEILLKNPIICRS